MPITEVDPHLDLVNVTKTIQVFHTIDALLLDHIFDHLDVLALIAMVRAVPDTHTEARLAAHPRYRPYLENINEPGPTARLIWLLLRETQLLLTIFVLLALTRGPHKSRLYRHLRHIVPYIAQSEPPPPDDFRPSPQPED